VSPGGVIQLDDYGFWQGEKKATDEFLNKRNLPRNFISSTTPGADLEGRLHGRWY